MAVRTYLFDAEGRDREVALEPDILESGGAGRLVWIDVDSRELGELKDLARQLDLDPDSLRHIARPRMPTLDNFGRYIQFGVDTAPATMTDDPDNGTGGPQNPRVDFVISPQWLVTVHEGRLGFIDAFRSQDRAETMIGALTPHDFAASLLDAHLEAYFEEIARIEAMVDRLDEQALTRPSSKTLLRRLVALRRRVSRLRARLSSQRTVFYGLSRPDLQVVAETGASAHFQVLIGRFERAIDEVEHTRDLVVGSFDLFASRTAQQTNELVKVLTYLTAVIGMCALVAGAFGMNFETNFFELGDVGFYGTLVGIGVVLISATAIARWRNWI